VAPEMTRAAVMKDVNVVESRLSGLVVGVGRIRDVSPRFYTI
jgi:hypothetical protein